MPNRLCPCGSKKDYSQCCGLYIESTELAPTPEALMRSRFSAYCAGNIDYIKNTMREAALLQFDEISVRKRAKEIEWQGLTIIDTFHRNGPEQGFVQFLASYKEDGHLHYLHELSEFKRHDNKWYYVDGELLRPPHEIKRAPVRNKPCPCGSLKKYKNCHGLKSN